MFRFETYKHQAKPTCKVYDQRIFHVLKMTFSQAHYNLVVNKFHFSVYTSTIPSHKYSRSTLYHHHGNTKLHSEDLPFIWMFLVLQPYFVVWVVAIWIECHSVTTWHIPSFFIHWLCMSPKVWSCEVTRLYLGEKLNLTDGHVHSESVKLCGVKITAHIYNVQPDSVYYYGALCLFSHPACSLN